MSERLDCPCCGAGRTRVIYELDGIPVQSCILFEDPEAAREIDRGQMILRACDACGLVFNSAFDSAALDYASMTEESQHFSGTFNAFARRLVDEIVGRMELRDKKTVEVGCGKGDFLRTLVRHTGTRAIGIDPGFLGNRDEDDTAIGIEFRKEYFDPDKIDFVPDLVVCRHTLEHIPDVGDFVQKISDISSEDQATQVFFETPDVRRVLAEGAFWDVYYEHCSYFSTGTHARAFRASGLHVTEVRLDYDDQYIIQYAHPGTGRKTGDENDLDDMRAYFDAFPKIVADTRRRWVEFVKEEAKSGRRVAIWGGGSKAVAFLTTNGITEEVSCIVDINPFKQNRFLPGTGHAVLAPDALKDCPPDTVIAMNPIYIPEIRRDLDSLGVPARLVGL